MKQQHVSMCEECDDRKLSRVNTLLTIPQTYYFAGQKFSVTYGRSCHISIRKWAHQGHKGLDMASTILCYRGVFK